MESLLCDEVLQEIFQRLPPSSSTAVPLVCKRWLIVHRNCKSSLFLRFPSSSSATTPSLLPLFSSFLSRLPRLSSLTLVLDNNNNNNNEETTNSSSPLFSDQLLLTIASNCPLLRHLQFLAGPVSPSSLLSLSSKQLSSLTLSSLRPLSFHWLTFFPFLKDLSVLDSSNIDNDEDYSDDEDNQSESELPLERLCLTGIRPGDRGLRWLWKSCTKLRKLQLQSCEGTGDDDTSSCFVNCLPGLQELELRTCRAIANGVLLQLAQHCDSLQSLLLYDGGSRDGLHRFISRCRSNLRRLDLRLPLDLDNDHLSAVAENFRGLVSLRLQSCCFVTGEGLKTLGTEINTGLEEIALINCDVVEREPGLLTTLGQSLRGLCKLDLSFNEMLSDKELASMLFSCKNLVDIKLRGCRGLTGAALLSMFKSCKLLETIDIKLCCRIEADTVEFFLLSSPRLKEIHVEESKLSGVAKKWASQKFIQIIG